MLDGMWTFLFVGTFGAIAAAMALGTGAALLRYHRTGHWPGATTDADGEVSTGRLVMLYVRTIVGTIIAIVAFASLQSRGLVF